MLPGFSQIHLRKRRNVGGKATLPPTPGLRAAYNDAYAAAYVEPRRQVVSVFFGPARSTVRFLKNRRKTPGKGFCHACAFSR
jgi:hypothetical protein